MEEPKMWKCTMCTTGCTAGGNDKPVECPRKYKEHRWIPMDEYRNVFRRDGE